MKCEFCGSRAFSFYEPAEEEHTMGLVGESITYIKCEARCEECKAHYKVLERWERIREHEHNNAKS